MKKKKKFETSCVVEMEVKVTACSTKTAAAAKLMLITIHNFVIFYNLLTFLILSFPSIACACANTQISLQYFPIMHNSERHNFASRHSCAAEFPSPLL